MANIKDVAKAAGVSVSTVSYAFNGARSISEEVRRKIFEISRELGYDGNKGKTQKSKIKLIALLGCNVEEMGYNTYIYQIIMGILSVFRGTDYRVVILPEIDSNGSCLSDLDKNLDIEGAIVVEPKRGIDYYQLFKERKIPVTIIGHPGINETHINHVDVDNVSLGYRSVKYFLDRKINNILFINAPKSMTLSEDREKGFYLAFKEMGISSEDSMIINVDISLDEAYRSVESLYCDKKPFSAIITACDLHAIGALNAIKSCGYNCPNDVSLFCCGETFVSVNANPPISGMDSRADQIGIQAASLIVKLIQKEIISASHISLPAVLNERKSVK